VPAPHTQAPDWVALSGVSPEAHSLHTKLAMHMNRDRGDALVWPGADTLAAMMGVSRGDKVTKWLAELVEIDAIEIRRVGMPRRNLYVVNTVPAAGYAGPTTLKQWYALNRPGLEESKAAAKLKRDARRAAAKPQVNAVAPESGEHTVTPKSGEQVTPKAGEHVSPDSREHVTPVSGREQDLREPDLKEQIPPTPRSSETAAPVAVKTATGGTSLSEEERKLLNTAVEVALAERSGAPGWSQAQIVAAIEVQLAAGAAAADIALAVGQAAADKPRPGHAGTGYPGRIGYLMGQGAPAPTADGPLPTRVVGHGDDRCRTHPAELARNCTICVVEPIAAEYDPPQGPAMPGAAAREEIRKVNAATAARRKAADTKAKAVPAARTADADRSMARAS
jgi:hypothetical protein